MQFIHAGLWGALRWALVLCVIPLAGCMDGGSNADASASGGTTSAAGASSSSSSASGASLVLVGAPATEVSSGSDYSFQPFVSGASGTVVYSITGKPSWMAFDTNTGQLSGHATDAQIGASGDIVITVTAASTTGNIGPFRITVKPASTGATVVNAAPTRTGTPGTSAQVGTAYAFTPAASDPDGNPLTFSIVNRPSWAAFDTATGRLGGTPIAGTEGTYSNIFIRVSDGLATVALPAFAITVQGAGGTSSIASISGSPTNTVMAGVQYSFTPTATGSSLVYSVKNLPAWATFDSATGRIQGTPGATDVGSYGNIEVSVSDGKSVAALPAFSINVTVAVSQTGTGTAVLSWTPPQQNTDGTSLTDLVGYRISWGMDPNNLTRSMDLPWGGYLWMQATDLAVGTWYFSIRAYNAAGVESPPIIVSKQIT
jgi:hypothetical protein